MEAQLIGRKILSDREQSMRVHAGGEPGLSKGCRKLSFGPAAFEGLRLPQRGGSQSGDPDHVVQVFRRKARLHQGDLRINYPEFPGPRSHERA